MAVIGAARRFKITLSPLTSVPELGSLWRPLDKSGRHSFFLSWHWIGCWLSSLPSLEKLLVLKAERGGAVVGLAVVGTHTYYAGRILPLRKGYLNSTGNKQFDRISVEHNGLATTGEDGDILSALARSLIDQETRFDEWSFPAADLSIADLDDQRKPLPIWSETRYGYSSNLEQLASSDLMPPWLSRNTRQQLRRSIRKLGGESKLTLEAAATVKDKVRFLEDMIERNIASWRARNKRTAFEEPYVVAFANALVRAEEKDSSVELLRLRAGECVLGYLMNLRRNEVVYNYQSGFDLSDKELHPGYIAHLFAMRHYASQGARVYDFLEGDNQLKKSLATDQYPLFWQTVSRPTLLLKTLHLARAMRSPRPGSHGRGPTEPRDLR